MPSAGDPFLNLNNGQIQNVATAEAAMLAAATTATNPFAGNYRFPGDIDAIDHWLQISIFQYSRENRAQQNPNRNPIGSITLPVPAQLSTGYHANYNQTALSPLDLFAKDSVAIVNNWLSGGGMSLEDFKKYVAHEGTKNAISQSARIALDLFPGASGASLGAGVQRNPHMAVVYDGPNLRVHNLNYRFIMRNQNESNTLRDIVKFLKYSQAPEYMSQYSNHLYRYPDECEVTFHYPDYLFSIGPSVIQGITVDYHNGGTPAYFANTHAPVDVSLNIELLETSIITKTDIRDSNR